ncbi:hypothetical protein BH10BAC3_BH10BAC3_30820 [soil metagenome]
MATKMPGDPLSIFGAVGSCLSSEFEMQLAAAYHLDNQTHGPVPGAPSTWVAQGAFRYHGTDL